MILLASFLIITGCTINSKSERLITTPKSPSGKLIRLYYVEVGATAEDVIQVRKVTDGDHEILLKAFQHNLVKEIRFVSNDSLQLVLSDTTSYGVSKRTDTVRIVIDQRGIEKIINVLC